MSKQIAKAVTRENTLSVLNRGGRTPLKLLFAARYRVI